MNYTLPRILVQIGSYRIVEVTVEFDDPLIEETLEQDDTYLIIEKDFKDSLGKDSWRELERSPCTQKDSISVNCDFLKQILIQGNFA